MKKYLQQQVDMDNFELVSVIDDLPLWSAPFGLKLLDTIKIRKNINVLDIGCGTGFPLIEIAQRLGNSCKVYGIDPWERALERARLKMKVYGIKNVEVIKGYAENIPFDNNYFDLIVSNNGINNVADMHRTINECFRVCNVNAQMTVTLNLDATMVEFYKILLDILAEHHLHDEIRKMKEHINSKRKPLNEITNIFENAGFSITEMMYDSFKFRFADGSTLLNHYFIRYWFMDGWKNILNNDDDRERIFDIVETKLNEIADKEGEVDLTIPFVTIDCRRN